MRSLMWLVVLVATGALMEAVRRAPADDRLASASMVTLGLGFVLIAGWALSRIFAEARLPKLTGYMAAGIVAGPFVLGYLDAQVVGGLSQVNGVAVALIALTAGSEIDLRRMKPLLRSITLISLIAVVGAAAVLAGVTLAMREWLDFMSGLGTVEAAALATIIGVVVASGSPAVIVAIRAETQADGPVAQTILGVVVLADLLVIVLFAIASSVARALASGAFELDETLRALGWELFGSIGVGVLVGILLSISLRLLRQGGDLFVLAVSLVAAEVGRRVHLDPLLVMLAAGMFVENVTGAGEQLRHGYEDASLPVFIVFFTVVGASIEIDGLWLVVWPAMILVLVRAVALWGGTFLAARLANAPRQVQSYGGLGLLPQAGLANALAILVARTFPNYGEAVSTLLLGIVALNAVITPALFRIALARSGELGRSGMQPAPTHA